MREILFRGKRTDNGEWVEGYIYPAVGRDVGKWLITEVYDTLMESHTYQADPATVGQYTGLTDRNGEKVFEWDILKIYKQMDGLGTYYFPTVEYPALVVVKWDLCAWQWEVQGKETYYIHFPDAWCHYECEVIGNIHDNPELLEEEA